MEYDKETFFGLHFQPRHGLSSTHVLPARNLVEALEGLQRTIHLVAMMREGKEVRTRARVTRDIEDRFQLHCGTAVQGSYFQPTFVAERDQGLFSPDDLVEVAKLTRIVLEVVGHGDEADFKRAVPDSAFRAPILTCLGKMFGGQGAHYRLDVEDRSGRVLTDSVLASEALEHLRQGRIEPDTHSIVTGYFNKIDFKERKLSLLIPSTGRLISCIYEEQIEPILLENARDLVQLVGTIELDDDGNPHRIVDVHDVHPVNLDDIDILDLLPEYLKPAELNNLRVVVELSEDKQTYLAHLEDLGIEIAAYTRPDLIDALKAEVEFLWKNIAREEDAALTRKALKLKSDLRRFFKDMSE